MWIVELWTPRRLFEGLSISSSLKSLSSVLVDILLPQKQ